MESNETIVISPEEKEFLYFCISNVSLRSIDPDVVKIAQICESLVRKLAPTEEQSK